MVLETVSTTIIIHLNPNKEDAVRFDNNFAMHKSFFFYHVSLSEV